MRLFSDKIGNNHGPNSRTYESRSVDWSMRSLPYRAIFAFALCALSLPVRAQSTPEFKLPCSYGLLVAAASIREACGIRSDPEMGAALNESIGRMETYLVQNSGQPDILTTLARYREGMLQSYKTAAKITESCTTSESVIGFYRSVVEHASPQSLREETDAQLAQPYPLESGCL